MKNKIVCLLVWLAASDLCHPVVAGGVNGTMKKESLEKHRHVLCGNSCYKDNSCYNDFAFDPEKGLIQVISPGQVRVQGDLYDRMQKAVAYLDKAKPEEIWNGFSEGFWGADFSGRMLEAYSRLSLSGAGSERFAEIGENLLARQSLDGSFHNGKALSLYEKEAGFWFGNARGMMGLLWAYRFSNDERYLKAARELGDYYVSNYFNKKRLVKSKIKQNG